MESKRAVISVIIPAYNTEHYINRCLKSVLSQKNADFEVIVINDGSTDRTGELCKKWCAQYQNFFYMEQENQGQGSARNRGISHATGGWLVFLDADDELVPGALCRLQKAAEKDADIICYEFFLKRCQNDGKEEHIQLSDGIYRSNHDLIRESTSFLWDKMFRTDFWRKEKIVLDNIYGEDLKAVYLLEALCEKFILLREPLVRHYEHDCNLSGYSTRVMEITRAVEETIKAFMQRKLFEQYKTSLFYIVYGQYLIYQSPDFCMFQPGQLEIIRGELKNILKTYFVVYDNWLKKLQRTTLIMIGPRCRIKPDDTTMFQQVIFFSELESFVLNIRNYDTDALFYLIDLSQEGRCRRFGTRTDDWQKRRWKQLADEFFDMVCKNEKPVQIFVIDSPDHQNEKLYQILLEKKEVISVRENMPVMEMLASQKLHDRRKRQKDLFGFTYNKRSDGFWCKGEQYRLQFNEAVLNAWLMIKNRNRHFSSFFADKGYQKIAIYGMGYLGERLLEELNADGIHVVYGIDRSQNINGLPVYTMEDALPQADVIVVTVVHLFFEIKYELEKRTDIPLVSLEEIIDTLLRMKTES